MAPKVANETNNTQVFDFETMAIVLYAMAESGTTLGTKHYDMMSEATKGDRSASAFQHQFRKVKARARELQDAKKGGTEGTEATPKKEPKKRARSSKKKTGEDEADDEESPSKKAKPEAEDDVF